MTRETWCVGVLYPALLADLIWPRPPLHGLVALAAFGFLVCQAMILYRAKGIPAWRQPLVPWMLGLSGLAEGMGAMYFAAAIAHPDLGDRDALALGGIGAILVLANAGLWRAYRVGAKAAGIPPLARREIERMTPLLSALGHGLPVLLFLAATVLGGGAGTLCLGLGGLLTLAGGLYWKFRLITRAGYFQGFALPKLPQRGSGSRAAPHRAGLPAAA
jgi:phenylacetyl-CoA:acceptor oxidoreductase subunit 2